LIPNHTDGLGLYDRRWQALFERRTKKGDPFATAAHY
jgi:hypothetical protein